MAKSSWTFPYHSAACKFCKKFGCSLKFGMRMAVRKLLAGAFILLHTLVLAFGLGVFEFLKFFQFIIWKFPKPYLWFIDLLVAGSNVRMRSVGGSPGNIATYPWQVSLQTNAVHRCGGSIISPHWILSAAHCTVGIDPKSFNVRVGSSWHGAFGETINISQVVVHPEYTRLPTTGFWPPNNDFTLIKLERPLIFGPRVQPIELPDEDAEIADGTLCMTSGWGKHDSHWNIFTSFRCWFKSIFVTQATLQIQMNQRISYANCKYRFSTNINAAEQNMHYQ